ncbi:HEXXH motif-containing putative peptide modification protein [uncultured Tateyamaria sp.]|uniref:aKG-HExxH-type peptide beta-hydroxylase n=1 Tax=uncultured Tateyamaria sp. TaxID=455651 RepID=UPI0026273A1D|nr:HEXXH motif-containing putative peptide modification protein [uncultured Tateyamaria sp.]
MTSPNFSAFECFACADNARSDPLFGLVVQGYANSVISRMIEDPNHNSLAPALEGWMNRLQPLSATWHASISKLGRRIFDEGRGCDQERVGRLLLDLSDRLDKVDFAFELKSGLPIVHHGRIHKAKGPVRLVKENGQVAVHGLDAGLPLSSDGSIAMVETRQTVESLCRDGAPAVPLNLSKIADYGWAAEVSEGISLMSKVNPSYEIWVRRLLSTLILTERLENRTCSGSWSDTSGTVYMSQPNSLLEVGEVLIHECAHQHFHLACRVFPMKTDTENGRYFSPPVGRERPLDMILIAYHAFANVLTYYECAFDMSLGDQLSHNRYRSFSQEVAVLESYLDNNKGLSELGRTIFSTLRTCRQERICAMPGVAADA